MNAPRVDCEQHHASLAVSDVLAAADFYTTKLGFRLGFTWGEPPTMAGVNLSSTGSPASRLRSRPAIGRMDYATTWSAI